MATKKKESIWPDRAYPDLHDHLKALHDAGLLVTVDRPINKDTEMHPLVRWQFRGGIAEPDRKAFLFTNPTDSKERRYDIPVAVGVVASLLSVALSATSSTSRAARRGLTIMVVERRLFSVRSVSVPPRRFPGCGSASTLPAITKPTLLS